MEASTDETASSNQPYGERRSMIDHSAVHITHFVAGKPFSSVAQIMQRLIQGGRPGGGREIIHLGKWEAAFCLTRNRVDIIRWGAINDDNICFR